MKVVTWNLRFPGKKMQPRLDYLASLDWDVALLQEVTRAAQASLVGSHMAEDAVYGLDLHFGPHPTAADSTEPSRAGGSAILTRNGLRLSEARLIPGLPKEERGVWARVSSQDLAAPATAISWHAPNAAGNGVEVKMQGYRALIELIDRVSNPVVLGFDSNHWNLRTELEPAEPPNESDRWYEENLMFSRTPQHRLRDAYLDHLRANPHEYDEILRLRPGGPLAVSYVRGSKARPIEDRFDYIFVSPGVEVRSCVYEYDGAVATGSDHGSVCADLDIPD